MHRLVSKLIIYRNIGEDSILYRLADIFDCVEKGISDNDILSDRVRTQIHRLLDLATEYGFDEDLWRDYIAYLLAMTENPFTLVCEKAGAADGSVNVFADADMSVFRQLLDFDFSHIEEQLGVNCFSVIRNYKAVPKRVPSYDRNVSLRIRELSRELKETKGVDDLKTVVMAFYERYGVGSFGMNKAFRIAPTAGKARIIPITVTSEVTFAEIIGCEAQKTELRRNTESFLAGKPANNVLLYGDAGTGKSTSIKALLNEYYGEGLRIIEVYKHDFSHLPDIISEIKGRNYRFIIYMDDLSFEGFETGYKYLKAVIEGDLEERPENVLIYATSNRRHLIRESFSDRSDGGDDLHPAETLAEMMSLYDRFGLTISFFKPAREEYYRIVSALAARRLGEDAVNDELLRKAEVWAMRHGGMSGRTARQFVDHQTGDGSLSG